jgi:lipid II:glycine glycyltransferase (peptidoglycan interpeptide bridge formation enzyme)
MIGRANRLLHWDDIRYFKNQGYSIYDLGGISIDVADKERQAINKFKECFGAVQVKEYKSFIPVTFKGFACLFFKRIMGKQL